MKGPALAGLFFAWRILRQIGNTGRLERHIDSDVVPTNNSDKPRSDPGRKKR